MVGLGLAGNARQGRVWSGNAGKSRRGKITQGAAGMARNPKDSDDSFNPDWHVRRKGIPWPKKCHGPGSLQHCKYCHPSRPRCKWRRQAHKKWITCNCGIPHFYHRKGSVSWKGGEKAGACQHHPEADRINFEMISLQDFETGEPLDPEEITAERY